MKVRRDILTVIADTHIGHSTGLVCPDVQLDNGDLHTQSVAQAWTWQKWQEFWEYSYSLKPSGSGKCYLIILGDASDRPGQHQSGEYWTMNEAIVHRAAIDILAPHVQRHDHTFMLRGTQPHVGAEAEDEECLASELGCERNKERGTYSWWDLPLRIQDETFHFAHFTNMGSREWTRANAVNQLAAEAILDYAKFGETPPHFIVRAHVHRYSDSFQNYPIRAITAPAWQLKSSYVKRKSPMKRSDIGGMVFVVESGSETQVIVKRYYALRHGYWQEGER
jgi:hypothetical protein